MAIRPTTVLTMPKIAKLRLEHLTLYSSQPSIEVVFPRGVFCLAGANGLGKSTFLAALNYGLTGIVPPDRKYESVKEYYEDSQGFAEEFFDGRVGERDRKRAAVSLSFLVGNTLFELTRGIFGEERFRRLSVKDATNDNVVVDGSALNPVDRDEKYKEILVKEVGLNSFEQFVFLQQFVFTFDERRHLLFWDQKVLEQALHICFGVDPRNADRADSLRREAEKADSLVRNYQWDATVLKKKVQQLESLFDEGIGARDLDREMAEYKALIRSKDDAEGSVRTIQQQRQDVDLQYAQVVASVADKTAAYEKAFSEHFSAKSAVEANPVLLRSVESLKCAICGSTGDKIAKTINAKLASNTCPLCESSVDRSKKTPDILRKIDAELAKAKAQLADTSARRTRVQSEVDDAEAQLTHAVTSLDKYEREHTSVVEASTDRSGTAVQRRIAGYREQIQSLLDKKKSQYEKREEKRKALGQLQKSLVAQYSEAEERFVPAFKDLAHSFLGIDLDIRLDTRAAGVFLTLAVKDSPRRQIYQLSESQRFFVDIALRMALLQFTSGEGKSACLLIDTPEGSLDIAYESRAGDMFARFVRDGFNIIMTANINTSQLLLNLAAKCGPARMHLCRMTSWTELSEVQKAEEHLFNRAYKQIVSALKSAKAGRRVGYA
jgi:DNA repair exonuclease SbcCD ATPase subunit